MEILNEILNSLPFLLEIPPELIYVFLLLTGIAAFLSLLDRALTRIESKRPAILKDEKKPPKAEEPLPPELEKYKKLEPESLVKRLQSGLSRTRKSFSSGLDSILSGKGAVDDELFEELEELLVTSDVGVKTSIAIIESLSQRKEQLDTPDKVRSALKDEIHKFISGPQHETHEPGGVQGAMDRLKPYVILVVGVNGVGKTTTIGKLAARFGSEGKKVLIVAADTFRAAAVEQLTVWAERADADIVKHKEKTDPAAVAYDGVEAGMARGADVVIIDTAGRLHTKVNLMEEIKKIKRIVDKRLPGAPHEVLLVIDATTGQNAMTQTQLFNDSLGVDSIAITKLDGTAKGGIVISVSGTCQIPVTFIGVGESLEDLQEFDPVEFVNALF